MKATLPPTALPFAARVLACMIGSLVTTASGLALPVLRQCDGTVLDALERTSVVAADRLSSVDRLVAAVQPVAGPSRVDVWERPLPGEPRTLVDSLFLPEWDESWDIYGVAAEGDRIAHQLWRNFEGVADLVIHERVGSDWETSVLPLPSNENWLRFGHLAAVAGDQVLTLTSRTLNRPIKLQVAERGANGWEIVQVLPLPDLRSPWFENPVQLVHSGGMIAVLAQGSNDQVVAVCERDAAGIWSQTTLLAPPSSFWFPGEVAIADGEVAVAWRSDGTLDLVEIFGRNGSGTWFPTWTQFFLGQFNTRHPIAFDGQQVAFSDFDVTRVYRRSASGAFEAARNVLGRLSASDFSSGELVALGNFRIATISVPSGLGHVNVCSHVGQITCAGSGAAQLRVHEYVFNPQRRSVAEVLNAPPGAAIALFRSKDPGATTVLGGELCIDRAGAQLVGSVLQASAFGTATFELTPDNTLPSFGGITNADHLQAVVLGGPGRLTNSVAWLP